MSVAGDAVPDEGGQSDDSGGSNEPPEIEGDVPKPAFEEPEPKPEPTKTSEPRPTRREKRVDFAQERDHWRNEASRSQTELRELRDRLARLEGRQEAERGQQADPVQARLKDLDSQIDRALDRMGRGDQTAYTEWKQLLQEQQRFIARAEAAELAKENAKNAPGPVDPVLAAVAARHSWILTNKDARQVAEGIVARLVIQEQRDMRDPTVRRQTLMQAAAEAARDLNLGEPEHTEPSEVQRERFRGVSGQSTGGSRGSGKAMVALTADQKAQAEALFRHMEPEAAHKEWWSKVGKGIAERSK